MGIPENCNQCIEKDMRIAELENTMTITIVRALRGKVKELEKHVAMKDKMSEKEKYEPENDEADKYYKE